MLIVNQEPEGGAGPGEPSPEERRAAMPELDALERSVDKYVESSKADNTLLAYRKQWDAFKAWCATKAFCELPAPPETVALYLAACADAGLAVATLAQAKAVITREHEDTGHTSPCASPLVKQAWAGIRRRLGVAPNQKQPLDAEQLRAMYDALPAGLIGIQWPQMSHCSRKPAPKPRTHPWMGCCELGGVTTSGASSPPPITAPV